MKIGRVFVWGMALTAIYSAGWHASSIYIKKSIQKIYHQNIKKSALGTIFLDEKNGIDENDMIVSGFPFHFHVFFPLKLASPLLRKSEFKIEAMASIPELINGNVSIVTNGAVPLPIGEFHIKNAAKYNIFESVVPSDAVIQAELTDKFGAPVAAASGISKTERAGSTMTTWQHFDAQIDSRMNALFAFAGSEDYFPLSLKTQAKMSVNDGCIAEFARSFRSIAPPKIPINITKACAGSSISDAEFLIDMPELSDVSIKADAMIKTEHNFYLDLDIQNLDKLIDFVGNKFMHGDLSMANKFIKLFCKMSPNGVKIKISGDENGGIRINGIPVDRLFSLFHRNDKKVVI